MSPLVHLAALVLDTALLCCRSFLARLLLGTRFGFLPQPQFGSRPGNEPWSRVTIGNAGAAALFPAASALVLREVEKAGA